MFSSSHSFLIRYSAVGLAVTLGLLITASIELLRERAPFLLFFAAVILITRLYGRGPGIATLILAVAITDFFLIPPIYSFVPNVDDAFRIGTFTLLGILTIWIVSSLMQREKEARDNEARYRMLFDYSPDGIVVTDTKANSIDANENICRMLGYTRDELVGKNVSEMIVVAEIPHIDEALELLEAGSEHVREWVFRRKDGSTFLSESRATQMPDGNLMGVIRDISDRKLALVAADELAAIVTSSHDAIIGKDLDGIVTSWNAGAERIYGYSADEMIGQPITRLIPPDRLSEEDDIDANIRQGEATGHFETKRLRNDGNLIDVSITASPIKDAAGNVVGASKVARDITERNLSEEALQASERRLRTIIETEPECVKVISSKGRLMEMNPAGLAMLEAATLAEVQAKPLSEFILPEYRDAFRDLHRLVMSGGSGILEFEVIGLNGGRRWLETHAAPMRDAKNEVVALLGVTRDITERKRAETKLRESEASFRSMANSMSQLAWIAKPDGFIFWYNHRWYEYTGTTQEEMEGWGWQSVHDPEVLPVVMEKWPAAIAAGTEFEMEFPIRGADGIFRLFLTRAVPLKDDQGRVVQWFGTNTDVDQLKLVQETLRSSQATLQGIIESAMDAIVSVDNEQNIVVFNSAAEKMFAFPAAEAIGKPLNRFIPQRFRPGHSEHIENFGKTNVTRRSMGSLGALYGLRSDGEEFPIEASISQIETDGKPIYTVILRDVTERKLAEENIKSLNKNLEQRVLDRTAQLESASRELESFSYSVSHDLRAPLRHIDGFTKLLVKREAAKLDTKSAHYLDVISGSVGKMGVLIDELLTFSRTTRQELKLDSVDLNLLIKDSMEMLEPARSIVWKVESLPIVEGDKTVLGIVLTNLLSNAIKYSRHRDEAIIEIGLSEEDDSTATVYVRDNGAGFDMQYADRLFGVFQRLHREDEFEGVGIGLATVQRIINRHGGRIWPEAEIDRGATFYFSVKKSKGEHYANQKDTISRR